MIFVRYIIMCRYNVSLVTEMVTLQMTALPERDVRHTTALLGRSATRRPLK